MREPAAASHANRGRDLEEWIEYANAQYRARGVAVIQKVATPTKVLPGRRGELKVVRSKSTVDFVGVYQGRGIAFDAKSTHLTRFPLVLVHDHQYEFLREWADAGGVAFLLVQHGTEDGGERVCVLPVAALTRAWERWKAGGRASLSHADLLAAGYTVGPSRGVVLDYLRVVDAMM